MRVLVLEEHPDTARDAQERLTAAGMDVLRCHEPGAPAFPCDGMPGGAGCPLETTTVDVALTVGPSGDDAVPTDGVRCALRHHVPVVASGLAADAPWHAMVHAVDADADVVGAVVAAADAPLRRHGEVATAQLRDLLERKGVDASRADVVVERRAGGVVARLQPGVELDTPVLQAAAVRVAAALRALDDKSVAVDVTVAPAPEPVGAG